MVKEVYWNCKHNWVWERKKTQTTYFALYHEKLGFDEKKKHTATLLKYNIKILDLDNLGSESGTHENNL